jgi:fructose PTS system EIIA component
MQELLNKDLIQYQTNLSTKEEVFETIASLAVEQGIATDKNAVVKGLVRREEESTTGFFDGFAIPHTKVNEIKQAGIIILVNQTGIEWNSMDGNPAKFFISLLIPEAEGGSTHLQALAAISRMLMHEEVRQALLEAKGTDEIYEKLMSHLQENN